MTEITDEEIERRRQQNGIAESKFMDFILHLDAKAKFARLKGCLTYKYMMGSTKCAISFDTKYAWTDPNIGYVLRSGNYSNPKKYVAGVEHHLGTDLEKLDRKFLKTDASIPISIMAFVAGDYFKYYLMSPQKQTEESMPRPAKVSKVDAAVATLKAAIKQEVLQDIQNSLGTPVVRRRRRRKNVEGTPTEEKGEGPSMPRKKRGRPKKK